MHKMATVEYLLFSAASISEGTSSLSFSSLLILSYRLNFLGLNRPRSPAVISPMSLFSLLKAFYLSLYRFLNPSSPSSFSSQPSDSACLALSHRCVCSVSQPLTLWPTFFSIPFPLSSPLVFSALPSFLLFPQETVKNYTNLHY